MNNIDILDEAKNYCAVEGTDEAIRVAYYINHYFEQKDKWINKGVQELAERLVKLLPIQ
jgi:hypothetical protein